MYRAILEQYLLDKQKINPMYSMRCFARDVEIPSSHMSKILRGLQGMSEERANHICDKLHLENLDREFFVQLVLAEDARSKKGKLKARQVLKDRFSFELDPRYLNYH